MLSTNSSLERLLIEVPGFQETWREYSESREASEITLCGVMFEFTDYVSDLIEQGETKDLPRIFTFIEKLIVEGDQDVKDAAATCFLENLINYSDNTIPASSFVPLLGPKSRDYCKGWDEFTGVKTEGL